MSISHRLLNISMLRGCKFRVTGREDQDYVNVPIFVPTYTGFNQEAIAEAHEMARERIVISKKCAQAYLDLYERVTGIAISLKQVSELCRQMHRASIGELPAIYNRIDSIVWGLNQQIESFLEDEEQANKKCIDV